MFFLIQRSNVLCFMLDFDDNDDDELLEIRFYTL